MVFPLRNSPINLPCYSSDLLTRSGHQGEALREPRLRSRLRISIILPLPQHVFHSCCSMHFYHRHLADVMPPLGGWEGYPHHQDPAHLSLDTTEGPGSYRDLLYGVLLPAAPAQAFEDARPPDESGLHPKGIECCAVVDSSPQGHRRTLCQAQ